jgi:Rod binding domain-containing protein
VNTPAIMSSAGRHSSDIAKPDPAKTLDAASQFEALLIASMLKASREAGSSWLGTGDDQAGASAISYAEEHLSQVLASQGGLGIARMVVAGLESQKRPYIAETPGGTGAATTAAGISGAAR